MSDCFSVSESQIPMEEIFSVDAYTREFSAIVLEVDKDQGRVALDRTAFFPGGGGQPHDLGTLSWGLESFPVHRVKREGNHIWHSLDHVRGLKHGVEVHGTIDWGRRYSLMRTHAALHVLCGVMWRELKVSVTGGTMEPLKGRLDFALDRIDVNFGKLMEEKANEEISKGLDIQVDFVPRSQAERDASLIRTQVGLLPPDIDPLRTIDIVGLDKQADGGTHVSNTSEIGRIEVTGTSSKGKHNKRIRIEVREV